MPEDSTPVTMTSKTFADYLKSRNIDRHEVGAAVRSTLDDMLGEPTALATRSYSGDATDGNYLGFATRLEELYGGAAPNMFDRILSTLNQAQPVPARS